MKLVSWNVNGIRACLQKGFLNSFHQLDADIFCVQETKMQRGQADLEIEGYHYYLNSAVKKGYSGTLIYSKEKPLNVFYGMNKEEHDQEGRLITLEFENYYVITCYTPNSQNELKRLSYRMKWEDDFLTYLESLDKPIILCGDLNVAHKDEIIELNLKLNKSKIHSFLIHYFFNDKKMIRTYPNLKQEKLDGTIVYFKDLLPDIKPYYYKFVAKDFYK